MGDSSGGWATAFAATTSDTLELDGETGVDGTSSAVQVAVAEAIRRALSSPGLIRTSGVAVVARLVYSGRFRGPFERTKSILI